MNKSTTEQERIDREAADWVVKWEDREHTPAAQEQSRWFGWLRRSPQHLQSYLVAADLYERLGRIDPDNKIDVDDWLADRRAPVVSLATSTAGLVAQRRSILALSGRGWLTAAVFIVSIVGMGGVALWNAGVFTPDSYRTAVGQQSINRLADGSVMSLNTHSKARVSFSDEMRLVELEGEALFTVAKDPSRPFLVRTGGATVRVLGTRFNVYEQEKETRVTVLEGAVQVSSKENAKAVAKSGKPLPADQTDELAGEILAVSAGEAARVSQGRVTKVRTPDIEAQIAWREQKLIFEDAPLAQVAAEFNRYNQEQFRIEGPIGETKRLSGTFDALHPQPLLLYLRKDSALIVESSGKNFIVRAR